MKARVLNEKGYHDTITSDIIKFSIPFSGHWLGHHLPCDSHSSRRLA